MASWDTFKLSELRLDQVNYRTGPRDSQRDAIRAIIDDQKGKLVALARDLLDVGPSPGEPIWVTRDTTTTGMYVVLEGNRRVAALKLMETPSLADGTEVEKAFGILATEFQAKPIRELEARVFGSRDDALPWQRRRHMTSASGVGLQGWKPLAKARANRDLGAKALRALAVVELLEEDTEEWSTIAEELDSKWSTVDRVLNSSSLPTLLGVTIDPRTSKIVFENGDAEAGKDLLRAILATIASPSFRFALVEKDTDRETFVGQFTPLAVKAPPPAAPPPGSPPPPPPRSSPPSPPPPPPKGPLTTPPRATLAPRTGSKTFRVDGTRLNRLYRECREVKLKGNENAAALLLRVFIELSTEALLAERAIPIPSALGKKGVKQWADFGASLRDKVTAALTFLDVTGRDKLLQPTRVALDPSSHAAASIQTLNGYFHNLAMTPDATAVREAWDTWENYLRLLHASRI
ncbi:MAG TPA: hypothetical protein VHW60_14090 [Caulobacteraceae bacterium]|jgi:hypothetical protein|nr:hypothetical protein [Caulobacteraceae bacterium]